MALADGDGATGFGRFAPGKRSTWDAAMQAGFLDHLAAQCNVKAAAAFVGVDVVMVYLERRRDPAFAAAWSEALALGYEMLETQLVGHALAGSDGAVVANGTDALPPVNVDLALRLLSAHRNAAGKPKRTGPRPRVATPEETDRAILAMLKTIEARPPERRAAAAALPAPREEVA